jgi:hypothetical protein
MREFAARHDGGFDQRARDLRAENARRAAAATTPRVARVEPLQWLDDATRSVPAYEVLS